MNMKSRPNVEHVIMSKSATRPGNKRLFETLGQALVLALMISPVTAIAQGIDLAVEAHESGDLSQHHEANWKATNRISQASAQNDDAKEALIVRAPVARLSVQALPMPGDSMSYVSPHVPLDGTWTLVDFCLEGSTGSGSAQAPDCHQNDDDSSSVNLPFPFTLYGTAFTKVFINNNGNLSFDRLFSNFTASGFPVSNFPMVAPFWGDVDTGNPYNPIGQVYYKMLPGNNTLAVTWDNVGYYNENADKLNSFQVLISDGTNGAMGLGNNVCFAYDDMQWTTGDASGGSGGFGGTPATVGANAGNGVDFFQFGRFDKAGTDYDGPSAGNDGVDFLDGLGTRTGGSAICFNASGLNVPPVPLNFPANDSVTTQCEQTLDLTMSFLSPEADQSTSVLVTDLDGAQSKGLVITHTPGNTATINVHWQIDAYGEDVGTYELVFEATDSEADTTTKNLTIAVECPEVDVTIDIKPGSRRNPINRKSNGVVPVAILGSEVFDVSTVDVTSLLFGTCGDEVATPAHTDLDGHYEDVNGDGFGDLVTHYRQKETNFMATATEGCLFGTLVGGAPFFVGTDSVRIVK